MDNVSTPANPEEPWRLVWRSPSGRTEFTRKGDEVRVHARQFELIDPLPDSVAQMFDELGYVWMPECMGFREKRRWDE